MDNFHYISSDIFSLENLQEIVTQNKSLALSEEAIINIEKCRAYLDKKMASQKKYAKFKLGTWKDGTNGAMYFNNRPGKPYPKAKFLFKRNGHYFYK